MKKSFKLVSLALSLTTILSLAACDQSSKTTVATSTATPASTVKGNNNTNNSGSTVTTHGEIETTGVTSVVAKPTLNVLTYEEIVTYGVAKALTPAFEEQCKCSVNWQVAKHQHLMLNQYLIDQAKAKYDVIFGVNIGDATLAKTKYDAYFSPVNYDVSKLDNFPYRTTWDNMYAEPLSSSAATVVFNQEKVKLNPTQYPSWKKWIEDNHTSFIFGSPTTNDLGKALNRVIAYYYPTYEQQVAAWQKIKAKTVTIGKSWSSSYGIFAKGESDSALGYSSSIIYHRLVEKNFDFDNLVFKDGSPFLVDSLLIPNNAHHPALAQALAKYMLTASAQKILFSYNSSYPVVKFNSNQVNASEAALAAKISEFPVLDVRNIDPKLIASSLKAFQQVFTN